MHRTRTSVDTVVWLCSVWCAPSLAPDTLSDLSSPQEEEWWTQTYQRTTITTTTMLPLCGGVPSLGGTTPTARTLSLSGRRERRGGLTVLCLSLSGMCPMDERAVVGGCACPFHAPPAGKALSLSLLRPLSRRALSVVWPADVTLVTLGDSHSLSRVARSMMIPQRVPRTAFLGPCVSGVAGPRSGAWPTLRLSDVATLILGWGPLGPVLFSNHSSNNTGIVRWLD